MNDTADASKSMAERWFEEQQAWQRTMRDYADSMAKDEAFLTHLGNAMRGSLLAGTSYPTAPPPGTPGVDLPKPPIEDKLDQVLFALKSIDGRLRDLEDALEAASAPAEPAGTASPSASRPSTAKAAASGAAPKRTTKPRSTATKPAPKSARRADDASE